MSFSSHPYRPFVWFMFSEGQINSESDVFSGDNTDINKFIKSFFKKGSLTPFVHKSEFVF